MTYLLPPSDSHLRPRSILQDVPRSVSPSPLLSRDEQGQLEIPLSLSIPTNDDLPYLENYPFVHEEGLDIESRKREEIVEEDISDYLFGLTLSEEESISDYHNEEDPFNNLSFNQSFVTSSIPSNAQTINNTLSSSVSSLSSSSSSSSFIDISPYTHNSGHRRSTQQRVNSVFHSPTHRQLSHNTHPPKPFPIPLILTKNVTRLSASFINLSSPLLGSHTNSSGNQSDQSENIRIRSKPRPRLDRSQSTPLPYKANNYNSASSKRLDPLAITQKQSKIMSFKTPEGQSSFDFGDSATPNTSPWKGLRRALSLGSNASSSIGSKRYSYATASGNNTTRLSRQIRNATTSSSSNIYTTDTSSNSSKGDYSQHQHQHQHQILESDLSDIRNILKGQYIINQNEDDEEDIEEEWHNNMVVWKEGESNGSLNSAASAASAASGSRSINTISSSHREEIPSGPSSPCDTDRFSISDYSLPPLPSFPKPPSIIHFVGVGDKKVKDGEIIEHEHTLSELVETPEQLTESSNNTSLDSSPIDPTFPFNSTSLHTQSASTKNNKDENENNHGRITPVSVVTSTSQPPYCPPSPALTPSPQFSSSNSPVLITPGEQNSPSTSISSLTPEKEDQENIEKDIQIEESELTQNPSTENTKILESLSSPLTPLIPQNTTPPSSSTPPLSFPSRIGTRSRSTSPKNNSTVPTSNANHFVDSSNERTINKNNSNVNLSLQPPIVLSTREVVSKDKKQIVISDKSQSRSNSMTFGEHNHHLSSRERDWTASYDNQDPLDPHPPQPSTLAPIPPSSYHHHKAQPSVPYSTRTTSTASSGKRYSTIDQSDALSPPPSFVNFSNTSSTNSSRRNSKYTVLTNSSGGSSIYSYSTGDSSSNRGGGGNHNNQSHWQFGGQPDISTVFEEENGTEFGEEENGDDLDENIPKKDNYEFGAGAHQRFNTLNTKSSSNTLVNRPPSASTNRSAPGGYFSREKSGTINSQVGTIRSNHSGKSSSTKGPVHPYANAVLRPTSPLTTSKSQNTFLSPQPNKKQDHHYSSLSNSKSSPNLAEQYKMTSSTNYNQHNNHHQIALISTEDDKDDEETCPVCVESLSFTYRLPGEKPHIVPECGHALHEECFVTVYGDVPPEGSKKVLGVCGVCRQPMKMADGVSKKDKLAAMMGQPGQNGTRKISQSTPSARSTNGRGQDLSPIPFDPNADDPLDGGNISSSRSMHSESSQPKVVVPNISIRSEFPSIAKGHRNGKQVITAMVTVEVPSAGDKGKYPTSLRPPGMSRSASAEDQFSPQLPPSPRSASDSGLLPTSARSAPPSTPDPFAHVVHDLKHRVVDYKSSGLDQLGSLRLFDLLSVRKGQLIREFHVYLFQEALICVSEEKKSGLRGIFSSSSSVRSDHSSGSHHGRGVLKLKGRIYVRHVKKVIDTSIQGELSLTITMEDESLDSFILCFKDRSSHETWRSTITRLLEEVKGGQSKNSRLMPSSMPRSANPPSSAGGSSYGMALDLTSPSTAGYAATPSTSNFAHHEPSPGDLAFEQPLGPIHTPIDLVIVLSLPASSSNNQLPLKVKLMKSSLAFTLSLLGPQDRISIVTCEMGANGIVRKTPFLSPCRYESRKRLEAFVETLGSGREEKDEFQVQVGREERFDVVTAVNVALDVVLQRKAKNPVSGMILVSDTSDVIKRAQMDLVTARLDAANVPVHALGYGRSHDPSPLWMISNHTHGTYTFVKEWYHLRDTIAGVVGGLMSIAMDNMKLHLSCQDNDFHVTKVSGTTQAIVSKNGKDVNIELRELRFGEIREILVELNLEDGDSARYSGEGSSESGGQIENGSSIRKAPSYNTIERGLGVDTLSVGDANALRDGVYEDGMIDEVPVVEVDCSFHDPGAGRSVARLSHPVLLTIALLPSSSSNNNSNNNNVSANPMIVRRRMELLASDMITRALLIASRKNFTHASRILKETKRIIETILQSLESHSSQSRITIKSKREKQTLYAIDGLLGIIQDLDQLLDGLEENKDLFERDHRNYSAQQAGVLRAQRSWTTKTPTERNYCTKEIGEIIQLSGEWQGRN
ncbi:uncharacterized protein L201_006136 [Kwoniella dendrophila CBS 6074]|uniref:RING-type domain-containing protein n=1 Tax=Kwoniella dendrophila CBS 6074 TaxID=1295534 RepID=A0AAX4K256_9TREE